MDTLTGKTTRVVKPVNVAFRLVELMYIDSEVEKHVRPAVDPLPDLSE